MADVEVQRELLSDGSDVFNVSINGLYDGATDMEVDVVVYCVSEEHASKLAELLKQAADIDIYTYTD